MPLKQGRGGISNIKGAVICLLLLASTLNTYCQNKEHINYVIPDVVNIKIENYIKENESNKQVYATLQYQNDTTSILISTYDASFKQLAYLISNTNRYLNVDSMTTIPLLIESDLLFSGNLHMIKNKGKYNEVFSHTSVNASGYLIVYKGMYADVLIVKAGYFQY